MTEQLDDGNPWEQDEDYQQMKQAVLANEARRRKDWQAVLSSPSGKRVMIELMQIFGTKFNPFDKHNSEMSRKCGLLWAGRYIERNVINNDAAAYLSILQDSAKLFANDN